MKRYFAYVVGFWVVVLGSVGGLVADQSLLGPGARVDPNGAEGQARLATVKALARRASLERGGLTPEALAELESRSLRLDQVMEGAPPAVIAQGTLFIFSLEKVGSQWAGFEPASDPYVVFLTREVYSGLGEDRALAFQDGIETVVFADDLDLLPALGLTVEEIDLTPLLAAPEQQADAAPQQGTAPQPDLGQLAKVSEVLGTGKVRLGFGEEASDLTGFEDLVSVTAGLTCPFSGTCPQYAPTGCASGRPVCPSGSLPYFMLDALLIRLDHEGSLKGNPEIELHPLNIDGTPIAFGFPPLSPYVFDGRTVCDAVGQARFLPDINKRHLWHTFSPTALYRASVADDWALTMVENDDGPRGRIDDRGSKISTIQVYRSLFNVSNLFRRMDSLNFLTNPSALVRATFRGGDDDLFQPAIGVTNDLFCNSGLNQGFPRTFTLSTSEWDLRGYFACVPSTCTPLRRLLRVSKSGSGNGVVTSSPSGINCGSDCSQSYDYNTQVVLTAAPSSGSVFMSWSGGCTGTATTCTVTMDVDKTVTATFVDLKTLTVAKSGSGQGTVTSSPAGISCGTDCSQQYKEGTKVTLTAAAASGSVFMSWSGGCTGTATTCTVTMSADKTVTATFVDLKTLTVAKSGSGQGTVTSSPAGISCGTDCGQQYKEGTKVTLTAAAASGSVFMSWSGGCTGTATTCTVTMDADKTVTAMFVDLKTLTVAKTGSGQGTVTSSPAGIDCGLDCSEEYKEGTGVVLSAASAVGSVFMGWSNGCAGTAATCTVTMDADKTVSAMFIDLKTLTVAKTGSGQGTVTSSPAGIDCGLDCSEEYKEGTSVTLTATPAAGSVFIRWGGACGGSSPTTSVVLSDDLTCEALFNRPPVAVDDTAFTEEGQPVVIAVLGNDSDPDGDAIEINSFDATSSNGGTVSRTGGALSYQPAAGFVGDDTFTYDVRDVHGTVSNRATVSIHVNAAPEANNDAATLDEDTSIEIDVLANDIDRDGDVLQVLSLTPPANGSAVLLPNQHVSYTPAPNFNGADVFTYTITDVHGTRTSTATAILTVLPVNDAPTPVCQDVTRPADGVCQAAVAPVEVDGGSSDVDGDTLGFGLTPAGPFSLGQTPVTLFVDDGQGEANSIATCPATITVVDVTAPLITCPTDVVTVTPEPATAVTFSLPTSTDNCTAAPVVSCTPQPGDLFPVGVNTVDCAALDESGNTMSCSFVVEVRTPAQQGQAIIDRINGLIDLGVLNGGQGNSLIKKINNALNKNNTKATCNQLQSFVNEVNDFVAQGVLTPEEGADLLAVIGLLQDGLGC